MTLIESTQTGGPFREYFCTSLEQTVEVVAPSVRQVQQLRYSNLKSLLPLGSKF